MSKDIKELKSFYESKLNEKNVLIQAMRRVLKRNNVSLCEVTNEAEKFGLWWFFGWSCKRKRIHSNHKLELFEKIKSYKFSDELGHPLEDCMDYLKLFSNDEESE